MGEASGVMPEQMTMLFGDESDWTHADYWNNAQVHACAINQSTDSRWYLGDRPQSGQICIDAGVTEKLHDLSA